MKIARPLPVLGPGKRWGWKLEARNWKLEKCYVITDRDEAWDLVCEWIASDSLRKHVLAVEAGVRAYARRFGGDEALWGVTALLHDLDFERYPDMDDPVDGHPRAALRYFREHDFPPELIQAVAGHAPYLGIPRTTSSTRPSGRPTS